MRRALVITTVVGLLGSCQPVATCSTDADCAPDGVCTSGLCVLRLAAGDGGVGDAGPVDAGGQDAGVDGGVPVDAGSDGGLVDAGLDAGPIDAGTEDAGVMDGGLPFDAGSCLTCPDGFACDEGLRACTLRVIGLSFARPDANDVYGGGRPIRLEVHAELDAAVPLPVLLQVTATPSDFQPPLLTLQPGVAVWVADTTTPADGGTWVLSTRAEFGDAGFSASSSFTVDARKPTVTLVAEPPPARVNDGGFSDRDPTTGFGVAYKKDELVELRVESSAPVTVTPSDFGAPAGAVTTRACTTTCTGSTSCQCFSLDLGRMSLAAMRGVIDAGVGPLPDALGNLSAPANVALTVTRWKWRKSLLEAGEPGLDVLHPPALDDDGRVHVGVGYSGNSNGALWQVLQSGDTRVDLAINNVPIPPIALGRNLYAQGDNNQTRRYDTTQGGVSAPTLQPTGSNFCTTQWDGVGSIVDQRVLVLDTSGRAWATTQTPTVCELWSAQPCCDSWAPRGFVVSMPLAGTAARLYFGRPATGSGSLVRVDFLPSASPRFQQERFVPNPNGTTSLVMFDDVVASNSRLPMPRTTVALSVWNAELTARVDGRIAGDAGTTWGPMVALGPRAQPTFVFGDGTGALRRFPYTPPPVGMADGGTFGAELPPVAGIDVLDGPNLGGVAPVLGANGLAYLVSPQTGRLSVVNLVTGALEWTQANAFLAGAVSPALDVARTRSLTKQCSRGIGVLYVPVLSDSALTAVVVDSPGLDGTSPWPRWHHDNGNTGNPETVLTPWTCP